MNLTVTNTNPSFSSRFFDNRSMRKVVDYTQETNQLHILDDALNRISHVAENDILVVDGKLPDGKVYSNFNIKRKNGKSYSVLNMAAETPEQTSFNAIIDLSKMGEKFNKLFGFKPELEYSKESVVQKYLIPNN